MLSLSQWDSFTCLNAWQISESSQGHLVEQRRKADWVRAPSPAREGKIVQVGSTEIITDLSLFIIPSGTGFRYVENALSMSASRRFVFGRKSNSENPDASHPTTPRFAWEAPVLCSTISAFRVEHFLLLLLQPQICQPACTPSTHLRQEEVSS